MTSALRTPLSTSTTLELSKDARIFRKEVLRVGKINYKGKVLDFTADYLDGLVLAHKSRAFDACHLVFAPDDNSHTQNVERIRGEALGFEREGDKLYALVRAANEDAAKQLRENPHIGVSLRIEQPVEAPDGTVYPAAVQHVLVTGNPRVKGMSPWEPIQLSADDPADLVIDLSTYDLAELDEATRKEPAVPEKKTTLEQLSPEELDKLRALLAAIEDVPDEEVTDPADAEGDADAEGVEDDTEDGDEDYEPSDAELAELLAQIEADDEQPVPVGLSNDDPAAVELSNQLQRTQIELSQLRQRELDRDYTDFVAALAGKGVPPYIVEKAHGLLTGSAPAVELSNGETVDPADIVREVLLAVGEHVSLIDMKPNGVVYQTATEQDDAKSRAAEMARYAKEHGLA